MPDSSTHFAVSQFRDIVNHQRSQSLNVVKSVVDQIFSAYPPATIDAIVKGRHDDPAVLYLLQGDTNSYKLRLPPILFPPGKAGDMKFVYRNEALINVTFHSRNVDMISYLYCCFCRLLESPYGDVQYFGADVHQKAILLARNGVFPEQLLVS